MNILIPDSWLRKLLHTKATPKQIAEILSLKSVSVERLEKKGNDYVYDIEITTNRPDLMSIDGIAKEANSALSSENIESKYYPIKVSQPTISIKTFPIDIKNDSKIVNRICAISMEVKVVESPENIKNFLEASGIRSLNNVIDITNYVMRETGHPTHVFDLDRLNTKELLITTSQPGDQVITLDGKRHTLFGDDIIAKNENGVIVDLLGVMGTANSVVTENTKNILFFVDNNNPANIRKTSMSLGVRSEAAVINEKGIDPNLAMIALLRGIELFHEIAEGKITSKILDIYPNQKEEKIISVNLEKVNNLIGVKIAENEMINILETLGFVVSISNNTLRVTVPTNRADVQIEEDIIEEIARIYGYHKLPSIIPAFFNELPYKYHDSFYFEQKVKLAMKYLGFTEVYTYSLVSEEKFEGPVGNALKIKNPLNIDMQYMRNSLIPGLLQVVDENKTREIIKIFELSNVYIKRAGNLPEEVLMFSAIVKKKNLDFYEVKGIVEEILADIGIKELSFKNSKSTSLGASIYLNKEHIGEIEVLDNDLINFDINFNILLKSANVNKIYKALTKFPAIHEDISIITTATTEEIIKEIKKIGGIIEDVYLKDEYNDSRTFHITYQHPEKNLTKEDVSDIRQRILNNLKENLQAQIRE